MSAELLRLLLLGAALGLLAGGLVGAFALARALREGRPGARTMLVLSLSVVLGMGAASLAAARRRLARTLPAWAEIELVALRPAAPGRQGSFEMRVRVAPGSELAELYTIDGRVFTKSATVVPAAWFGRLWPALQVVAFDASGVAGEQPAPPCAELGKVHRIEPGAPLVVVDGPGIGGYHRWTYTVTPVEPPRGDR